jgi:cytochrome-b5 reductase
MDNLISLLQESPGAVAVVVVLITAIVLYIQSSRPPIALSQNFQAFTLSQKEVLSHDTRRFTFAFPNPKSTLGLPVGQHMTLMFEDEDGKHHQRSYTPVSHSIGQVSFVIKIYMAGVNPKFPNGGKVSQHLESLKIGDSMMMKGPKGHLHWLGRGKFTIKKPKKALETRHAKEIGMIAGGTGITPMLQILHAIFQDSGDTTCCKLLYANQSTYQLTDVCNLFFVMVGANIIVNLFS